VALPNFVCYNGRVVPYSEVKFGVLTHAMNYGTAVFGGLRAYRNEDEKQLFIFRPRDHFRRFLQSASLLCMNVHTTGDDLLKGLIELIRTEGHEEDLYIRPLAFYSDEIIGVRLHDLTAEVSIVAMPFGS
jgi:branched-chain amino acid aminotransferase